MIRAMENYRTYLAGYVDESLPEYEIVFKALDFAVKLHAGQRRKSNEPYIIHPCRWPRSSARTWVCVTP